MCDKINHSLKVIMRVSDSYDEGKVVKWCTDCGAIVIDGEYDGRTRAGIHMVMTLPKSAKTYQGD